MSKEHSSSIPPRPTIKRSLTSIISKFSRKPSIRAPQRASSWDSNWQPSPGHPRTVGFASPEPRSKRSRASIEIVESGGSALSEAQDALTNDRRPVWTRILWTVPLEHNPAAQLVLSKIACREVVEGLSVLAIRRYLSTERGAFFCNVDRNASDNRALEVDWITFRDTQKTRDKTLQREVFRNEPALSVLVYVFRTSPDKRSIAIWRRKIDMPATIIRKNATALAAKRRELRATEAQYVIKISPIVNVSK
ncbi:Asp domain protein [Rhizoctonia solani 123E]|uniref:Asp domain protein n=1 Tax=Rhizoctonia solani 123E TaxID=1423351 RepID=A0A074S094_9AGAM|nr:Asp domain protein [Rhizoctonia solani 123E]